ncbi:MAG TPA: outer membrane protein assembly factor BamD [Tepidisphaeraceae bacterium]|jgi:tetratricopeptide (TPR) repeat protein
MTRPLPFLAVCFLLAAPALAQPTSRTFELSGGRFAEVPTTNPQSLPKPDPTLKRVELFIDRGDHAAARSTVIQWLVDRKNDPHYDRGLYLAAQALNGQDDPVKAFYYCDQLMDAFPGSEYFRPALELQFAMGDSLLSGRQLKFLGLPGLDGTDEGIEMMFRVQTRSPGSPLAERALRRTADFYFADGQFDLAADAYAAHIKSYPRDPNLPEVLVKQAFSNYAQFTGVRFDPTPLVNARAQMQDLVNKYPDVAKRENMQSFVDAIDKTLARKLLVTADFYKRTSKPEAQKQALRVLTQQYPQSDEAQQAKRILGEG